MAEPRIFPLGDGALTVEFGTDISESLNHAAISLANHFTHHPFSGFIEAVPAIASTTIFYRPEKLRASYPDSATGYAALEQLVRHALTEPMTGAPATRRTIEIPVSFQPEDAPDLGEVAQFSGLSTEAVIELFISQTYRVYMLGFLPGFPYLGEVDERIAMARRPAPRVAVKKGSVGIAGRQTGIYPSESPGGWQLIGRTDVDLLTGNPDSPCLLAPGDSVRFTRINR